MAASSLAKTTILNVPEGILPPGQTTSSQLGHSVVNLSNVDLTKPQVEALEKGLTFCPTPGLPQIQEIWGDLEEFFRRLRIKRFFDEIESQDNSEEKSFRNKSTWTPAEGQDAALDVFIKTVKTEVLSLKLDAPRRKNLTKLQFMGIQELSTNPHIVLKKADKGSCVVVMNTNDYIREGLRQLSNQDNYQTLTSDPTEKFTENVKSVLEQMLNEELISLDTFMYLNVDKPRPGRFYMLPKIHKKGIPGRPICSSNGHPTERISEFVDHHIRKYVLNLPSYIRDTQDFIKKIKSIGELPAGTILATMDVTSLYTNIPNKEGIDAVLEHVRKDHIILHKILSM
jgi:hypothetical protein